MSQKRHLLAVAHPPSLHRRIRHEEEDNKPHGHAQQTGSDKHDPPGRERSRARHVLEAERDAPAQDLSRPEPEVPEGEAQGLLRLGVPLAAEQDERRRDGALEAAQEGPCYQQGLVVARRGARGCGDAAEDQVEG